MYKKHKLRLPAIISDNMVLQLDAPFILKAWSKPLKEISIHASWLEDHYSCFADKEGVWTLKLPSPVNPNKKAHNFTVCSGTEKISVSNICFGEVWLASGQSNMEMPLIKKDVDDYPGVIDYKIEIAKASCQEIRFFSIERCSADYPMDDCKGKWLVCTPANAANFSAVAYFFARELHSKMRTPVGMIVSSWGGTSINVWMPRHIITKKKLFLKAAEKYNYIIKNREKIRKEYQQNINNTLPSSMPDALIPRRLPSGLYSGMINPLDFFALKGVLWFQGEGDILEADIYAEKLKELIFSWRDARKQDDLFFAIAQIATPGSKVSASMEKCWEELRYAQTKTSQIMPYTGIISTSDLGDDHIHFRNKKEVGIRLASCVIEWVYKLIKKG